MKRIVMGGLASASLVAGALAFGVRVNAQDTQRAQRTLGFPNLIEGLKAEPGCLGVETAQTSTGKSVIFAWFKDKAAVMHWYGSKMHQDAMNQFFPAPSRREPLSMIKENSGPLMVIASITPSKDQQVGTMPISQIAIEIYSPLPGGASVGGRFAPSTVKLTNHLSAPSFTK